MTLTHPDILPSDTDDEVTYTPDYHEPYTAREEIKYLREHRNSPGWREYLQLILDDGRNWDPTVDVGRVKRAASRMLGEGERP